MTDLNFGYEQLEGCTLEVKEISAHGKIFLLRKYPDRTMMSTYIIFTGFGIIISGDISVSGNGVIAKEGLGLDWFIKDHDPNYLASKFLKKRWIPEKAIEFWKRSLEALQNTESDLNPEYVRKPRTWKIGYRMIQGTLIDALEELMEYDRHFETSSVLFTYMPMHLSGHDSWAPYFDSESIAQSGWGYDTNEVTWLYGIQRRFAELFKKTDVYVVGPEENRFAQTMFWKNG